MVPYFTIRLNTLNSGRIPPGAVSGRGDGDGGAETEQARKSIADKTHDDINAVRPEDTQEPQIFRHGKRTRSRSLRLSKRNDLFMDDDNSMAVATNCEVERREKRRRWSGRNKEGADYGVVARDEDGGRCGKNG